MATVGCFSISLYMRVKVKHLLSDLVKVDSHTWMIDGVLSASILFAFILAYALELTEYRTLSPYVDPVLLIILGSAMLPVPFKILRESLNEVINKAPPEAISAVIEKAQLNNGGKLFAEHRSDFPAIVIFPQAPVEDYWAAAIADRSQLPFSFDYPYTGENDVPATDALKGVMAITGWLSEQPFVDTSRMYLMGLSMGAWAAMSC